MVGRRNKSYQNSGDKSKNGLDCNDVLSRLGIITIVSTCMMWNIIIDVSFRLLQLHRISMSNAFLSNL